MARATHHYLELAGSQSKQHSAATSIMDTAKWPPMAGQARKRLYYTISYMETGKKQTALAESGYRSPNTHDRVLKHLKKHGTFNEAHHNRAPAKFTNAVLDAAQEYLLSCDHTLTTPQLVAALKQQGWLRGHTDNHNFLQHFKQHLADQGLTLKVADTLSIFRITEETAAERLKFCSENEPLLDSTLLLEDMVVCDETTFEESPHPKGRGH